VLFCNPTQKNQKLENGQGQQQYTSSGEEKRWKDGTGSL